MSDFASPNQMEASLIINRLGQGQPLSHQQTQYIDPVSAVGVSPSSYAVPMQTCMGQPGYYGKDMNPPSPYQPANSPGMAPPIQFINVNTQGNQQFQMQHPQMLPTHSVLGQSCGGCVTGKKKPDSMFPKLLIIGGGFAGLRLAVNMIKSKYYVMLVDRKDFFEYSPSVPELYRRPEKLNKLVIRYTESIGKDHFIQGSLAYLDRNQATIKCMNRKAAETQLFMKGWQFNHLEYETLAINFDYCVVCIGSTYPAPFKAMGFNLDQRHNEIMQQANEIRDIRYAKVIIVGGGYVGIETACNVALVANKPVLIYNRGD